MTKDNEPAIPEPSTLPPNPSVGELRTEIDSARHDAARTVTALTKKLAPPVVTPTSVAATVGTAARRGVRQPMVKWLAAAAVLLLLVRRRRARRHAAS